MRSAVVSSVIVIAGLAFGAAAAGGEPAFTVTQLTDHLYQLSTDQGAYTTNSLVSVGSDGLLIVDTQAENVAQELLQVIGGFEKGVPKIIINTHRHVEHVGGNAVFGAEPIIIAHDLVPSKLRSGSYLFEEFPDATFPDITFSDRLTLFFNGEKIELTAMPGSHDDNEIIVHFTGSRVAHLSSLANGFNFPSVDADGSALAFPVLVGKALEILPDDVVIVSGHNRHGTIDDLKAYHEMLQQTIEVVRRGLAEGKDVTTLQEEGTLDEWTSFAGSYVSTDEWIAYIAAAIENEGAPRKPSVFEPLYFTIKREGAAAGLRTYLKLKQEQSDRYEIGELDLLIVGIKLAGKDDFADAVLFLDKSLEVYPDSEYIYYVNYQLALANEALDRPEVAIDHARRALALQPGNQSIQELLRRLETEQLD